MINNNIRRQIMKLPHFPGVYQFYNCDGKILYIGKAADLKNRVSSYFRGGEDNRQQIVKMVPRIITIRFTQTDSQIGALLLESELIKRYKPPYNIAWKDDKNFIYIKITIYDNYPRILIARKITNDKSRYFGPYIESRMVKKLLRYIQKIFPYRTCDRLPKKACLQYNLNRCLGPCESLVGEKEYNFQIKQIIKLLEGKQKQIIKSLSTKMNQASKIHRYETATIYRDRLRALSHIKEMALIQPELEANYHHLRNFSAAIKILNQKIGLPSIDQKKAGFRIEGYDISNIQGKGAVGSMVVFVDGAPAKDQYRKFEIKSLASPDDTAMMRQIIKRRFSHHAKDWKLPDLIILDGGKGQLGSAQKVLNEQKLSIKCLGLAKRLEEVFIINDNNYQKIILAKDNPALYLLQNIRDESHRFAHGYHLVQRKKLAHQSLLDEVEGIGPIKKKLLLKHFGSIEKIKLAKPKDLSKVVGQKTAMKIKEYL